jgi:hypothetical protein
MMTFMFLKSIPTTSVLKKHDTVKEGNFLWIGTIILILDENIKKLNQVHSIMMKTLMNTYLLLFLIELYVRI